ncbi:MAG: flagellar basal body-associated FliL family protein [Anaerolineae bacterium]
MKILGKLKLILPIVAVLLVVAFVAYTLFAPSTMWKPVYIRFENGAAAEAQSVPTVLPTNTPEPEVSAHNAEAIPYEPGTGVMYDLGSQIVNLAEPGGRRYLQIGIVLECLPENPEIEELSGEAKAAAEEEEIAHLDTLRPLMADAVISLLTSRTYAEVFTVEGKESLKQDMLSGINGAIGKEIVVAVYFTEFLVQ